MQKNIVFFILISSLINAGSLLAKETEGYKQESELKAEKKLTLQAKKEDLWLKKSIELGKEGEDTVEISLVGELYSSPVKIAPINKGEINRSTLEGALASIYSANEKGDIKWISENFLDEEKDEVKKIFKNKPVLKDSKTDAKSLESKYITGYVDYNDYKIIFIEQEYKSGRKITEALPVKETPDGWKTTNSLLNDTTFDIVFAAVSSGDVSLAAKSIQE